MISWWWLVIELLIMLIIGIGTRRRAYSAAVWEIIDKLISMPENTTIQEAALDILISMPESTTIQAAVSTLIETGGKHANPYTANRRK